MIRRLRRPLALALALIPASTFAAEPVYRAPAVKVLRRAPVAAPYHVRPAGPHSIYGTIVAIRGSRLTVKLRNGRLLSVDDSIAVAADDYSQPLFVGKLVAIDGTIANGVFSAAHIFRVTNLDGLAPDR